MRSVHGWYKTELWNLLNLGCSVTFANVPASIPLQQGIWMWSVPLAPFILMYCRSWFLIYQSVTRRKQLEERVATELFCKFVATLKSYWTFSWKTEEQQWSPKFESCAYIPNTFEMFAVKMIHLSFRRCLDFGDIRTIRNWGISISWCKKIEFWEMWRKLFRMVLSQCLIVAHFRKVFLAVRKLL
jgi:hypothetical protein